MQLPVDKWEGLFYKLRDSLTYKLQLIQIQDLNLAPESASSRLSDTITTTHICGDTFEISTQRAAFGKHKRTRHSYQDSHQTFDFYHIKDHYDFCLVVTYSTTRSLVTYVQMMLECLCETIHSDLEVHDIMNQADALFEQDKFKTHALDLVDALVWMKDAKGYYTFCNQAFAERQNMSVEDIIGSKSDSLFAHEYVKDYQASDEYVLTRHKTYQAPHYEIINQMTNKAEVFHIYKKPIFDAQGNLLGLIGICSDITRQNKILEQMNLISLAFDACSEAMVLTDKNRLVIDVNQAYEKVTGLAKADVVGKKPYFYINHEYDEAFYQQILTQLDEEGVWQGEYLNCHTDGSEFLQRVNINTVKNQHGEISNYFAIFSNISAEKMQAKKLHQLAYFDSLTGLPNRTYMIEEVQRKIAAANQSFAMILLDVDQFKNLNDTLGYQNADQVLIQIGERLKSICDDMSEIFLSHVRGNEFLFLLPIDAEQDTKASIEDFIYRIQKLFYRPFHLAQDIKFVHLTTSIGAACYPQDGETLDDLIRHANTALHDAKDNGRNSYAFYHDELSSVANKHLNIRMALREAIEKNEFHLVYQPQFSLIDNSLTGFEALLRWNNDELGFVSPADFIPVAEETGYIVQIGAWVVETACLQAKAWLEAGYNFGRIAVNVSAMQLHQGNFYKRLKAKLEETGVSPEYIEVEITEGVLLSNADHANQQLRAIRDLGMSVALDDFGTGYSSLSYLKGLPIDKLKIDRSFILDIPENPDSNNIVKAIVALANSMQIKVVVEGIETKLQQDTLSGFGCGYAQGFYLGRPLPVSETETILQKAQA